MAAMSTTQRTSAGRSRAGRAMTVPVVCAKSFFGRFSNGPAVPYNKYGPGKLSSLLTASSGSAAVLQRADVAGKVDFKGVHHVALLCENLERSLAFYQGVLGLEINPERPHHKLPYRGAWLWIGSEMIHLMELPNPDPLAGRPEHGGRDRHTCVGVAAVDPLVEKLEAAGVPYTRSMSGRPAVFFRDPDMNCLECVELEPWR
ncbi:hypothetical protein PLESTB_000158000 [Pleodorina starrii]|uniref:VOC domain-containing protein n=1 Tax=Pleodorina starrii TaxID=330485 RepID=A0A9W6BBT8_9CHLO|nr:hypothetical protein PLESTM_000456400 [Pleodorina starrii]GLC48875.1 hypothetical protein PLESTB_000158000 [Pleodorina starrii]GLC72604.1 hypothetical protein PLESTF_001269400 [Pleodorina starrii]